MAAYTVALHAGASAGATTSIRKLAFGTNTLTDAFTLVSTTEPGVEVFYENRPAGKTDQRGLLLIPALVATGINRMRVDPATWPIHWTASESNIRSFRSAARVCWCASK